MKIKEAFSQWGLFTAFENLSNRPPPWSRDITPLLFDIRYRTRSGDKTVSKFLEYFTPLDATKINLLATYLADVYYSNWERLYNTLNLEYNPISNYDMTETETVSDTGENTKQQTTTDTATESRSDTSESEASNNTTNTNTLNGTQTGKKTGFNSGSFVDDTQQLNNQTESGATNNTSTAETSSSKTGSLNSTNTINGTDTTSKNIERELNRSGNIGVTTSQQMIESERNLYLWKFFDVVFADIDKILTLKVYEMGE